LYPKLCVFFQLVVNIKLGGGAVSTNIKNIVVAKISSLPLNFAAQIFRVFLCARDVCICANVVFY